MEYISITQFAKLFGISRQAVWKWIRSGKVKAIRLGKVFRIPVSEVDRIEKGEK